ncbi:MAG: hypothetical protein J6V91_02490 [Kiritimatiellae bacterium]|jgi:hypothetical protein|nr:hypothetical protein [Kiritimatiellia bacterium]
MKKSLIAFAALESVLILTFILFSVSDQFQWLYPILLTLIGATFVAGIALLIFGKKR